MHGNEGEKNKDIYDADARLTQIHSKYKRIYVISTDYVPDINSFEIPNVT